MLTRTPVGPSESSSARPITPSRLGCSGRVEADHVRGLGHLRELQAARTEVALGVRIRRARCVDDLRSERAGHLRVAAADPAHADDADGGAAQLEPAVGGGVPALPAALAQVALGVAHPPAGRERQREGELGGRLGQDAGRVGHRHPALAAGVEVDVVVADREVRDNLEAGPSGVEHGSVDGHCEVRDDRVCSGDELQQLVAALRRVRPPGVRSAREGDPGRRAAASGRRRPSFGPNASIHHLTVTVK